MASSFHLKLLYSVDQRLSSNWGLKSKHCLLMDRATPVTPATPVLSEFHHVCALPVAGGAAAGCLPCKSRSWALQGCLSGYLCAGTLFCGMASPRVFLICAKVTDSWSVIYFIKAEKCPAGVSSGPCPRRSSWTGELVTGPKACKNAMQKQSVSS